MTKLRALINKLPDETDMLNTYQAQAQDELQKAFPGQTVHLEKVGPYITFKVDDQTVETTERELFLSKLPVLDFLKSKLA